MANGIFESFIQGKKERIALDQFRAEQAQQQRLGTIIGQIGQQPQPVQQPVQQLGEPVQPIRQPVRQLAGIEQQPIEQAAPVQAPEQLGQQPQVSRTQAMAQLAIEFPEQFEQINVNLGLITQQQKDQAADFAFKLINTPFPQRNALIQQRANTLEGQGRDASHTRELIDLAEADQNQALDLVQMAALSPQERARLARGDELSAGQKEFKSLTEGLSPEKKQEAALIALGLNPRAVGNAAQTIADKGTAEQVAASEAIIRERVKFAEMSGSARVKAIDSGFQAIQKIDKNVRNIDRAIEAVEAGAGVGAIESKFPSIKAASIALDQIQGELALDVVGAVTFGALSKGELDLAKAIALPTGLNGPELIQHLQDKKVAQEHLRAYFNEQIQHLDQGGSVASFMRMKERQKEAGELPSQQGEQQAQAAPAQQQPAAQGPQEGQTATNPQTGEKVVFTNGQWQTL